MPFAQYNRKKSSRFGSGKIKSSSFDTDRVNRSIENARTRIEDAGFKPEDTDQRNFFEKATNLPENQNAFFDILELLGRPSQGVLNVIKDVPVGNRTAGDAFLRGLTGRSKVRGSDIIADRVSDDKLSQTILGTLLEIGTDPLNLVPVGGLAKGVRAVAKPAGRGFAKFAKKIEPEAVRRVREETIQPLAQRGKDALGRAFVPDYKLDETLQGTKDDTIANLKQDTENAIRFQSEEALKTVANAAKTAGGVEAGEQVGRTLEAPLRQFEDARAFEFPDGMRVTEDKNDLLSAIGQNKEKIKNLGSELKGTNKEYSMAISQFSNELEKTESKIRKLFFQLERQSGKQINKETRTNIRNATREISRLESQLDNFGKNENSLLRHFKKAIRDDHESKFDLVKLIKKHAPNGIKGIARADLPDRLKSMHNPDGLDIGKLGQELGYEDVNDLLGNVEALKAIPRRLDNQTVETLARQEMERTGALKSLEETRLSLEQAKNAIQQSLKEGLGDTATKAEARAFANIAEDPRYSELEGQRIALKQRLDELRLESKGAKAERLAKIKEVEDEILGLKESVRNPVMIQKEIPRPQRELSTDPGIQNAAKALLQSNNLLRQWAIDTGVGVDELEGYMKHVLAAEERKRRKNLKALPIDRGNFGTGQPNKKVIAQRENMGSVEDINERKIASGQLKEGEKFFEPNAFFATAIGQKQLIEYVNAVNFRKQVLTNPSFAQPYTKGDLVPNNAVVIDSNNYKFLKDTDEGEDIVQPSEIGGEYIVTKAVKQALDRYQRLTTDEGINSFLKAWDSVQSSWKRLALFSIPYHMRNDIGAKFNNWVGGMNTVDLVKYSGIADKEVYDAVIKGQESPLYREFREQGLGSTGVSQIEFAKRGEDAEKAIERTIRKRSQNDGTLLGRVKTEVKDLKNPLNAFETSQEFGAFIDQTNRFALFKWFVDKNKDKIKDTNELYRMAAKKVRTVQFDYTRLTPLEREVFTRVVPFYRWMRNNIPYQIRSFINDPRKYANINKLRLNAQDAVGIDEENVPEWMKESFALPVTGDGTGSGQFLGLNLPLSDLNKISNPLKTTVDAVTPLAKLPAELSLNRNFFFNSPIEKFEGQEKQFQVPGTDQEFGIDQTLAYVLEQLTGQIGRGLSGFLQQSEDEDQDKKFRTPSLGISSILKDFDAEKSQYYQQLDELQKLMDLIDYIEQQTGQRPRTINEIN